MKTFSMAGQWVLFLAALVVLGGAADPAAPATSAPAVSAVGAPLVINGGFEEWGPVPKDNPFPITAQLNDGLPVGWMSPDSPDAGKGLVARDTEVRHSGGASVRMESPVLASIELTQCVEAGPNMRYRIEAWIKGENVSITGGALIHVYVSSDNEHRTDRNLRVGQLTEVYKSPDVRNGTFDWHLFSFNVDTPPETRAFRISLELRGASGKLWYDDVSVTPVEKVVQVESY